MILVFGSSGQVALALARRRRRAMVFLPRTAADLADPGAVEAAIRDHRPAAVINAAAFTAVDLAETSAQAAFAVNRDGPAAMARTCAHLSIPFFHLSTDYVFDGRKAGPYVEADPVTPINVYGASKAAGEAAVMAAGGSWTILRTAWVFGPDGHNFLKTMVRLAAEREVLSVVVDQIGCPTPADQIAEALTTLVEGGAAGGILHYCGAGPTSWHGFAATILAGLARRGRRIPRLAAIPTADYPTPAARPANAVLDCTRIRERHGILQPDWRDAVERTLDGLG